MGAPRIGRSAEHAGCAGDVGRSRADVLSLAGIAIPATMQGRAFLGLAAELIMDVRRLTPGAGRGRVNSAGGVA